MLIAPAEKVLKVTTSTLKQCWLNEFLSFLPFRSPSLSISQSLPFLNSPTTSSITFANSSGRLAKGT